MNIEDLGFNVIEQSHGHVINFEIYKGNFEDEPFMRGSVKQDGCSNWDFFGGHYPLHFCGRKGLNNFYQLIECLYARAAELMPTNKDMIMDDKY